MAYWQLIILLFIIPVPMYILVRLTCSAYYESKLDFMRKSVKIAESITSDFQKRLADYTLWRNQYAHPEKDGKEDTTTH